jgi:periplasmic protein TonB
MRGGLFLGILCAIALHVGALLFGGLFVPSHGTDYTSLQKVDLVSETDAAKVKEKEKPKEPEKKDEEIETETEEAPDAAEIIEKMELSAAASAPKLEAASLGAIEAALSGQSSGGGDFGTTMDFASGGRIGGMAGKAGGDQELDKAFSMSEIDQKPRVLFQSAPVYPAGMRAVEGVVTVIFIVDATGRVGNLRVEKSTNPEFEKPAMNAVRQWKFEPAVRGGERVPCKMRVPIRFQPR